jgi:hypothetical protein
VRGSWLGPASEKPAITGAKFLKTLDALSGIDPIFSGWKFTGPWQLSEGQRDRYVPLAAGRERVAEIIEQGVYIDDFKEPCPELGHSVFAVAGRGDRAGYRLQHRRRVKAFTFRLASGISRPICRS